MARHFFTPNPSAVKAHQRKTHLKTLPTWRIRKQLDDVEAQKAKGKQAYPRKVWLAILKRQRDLTSELIDRNVTKEYKEQQREIANPLNLDSDIQAQRKLDEHPARKADCRCANRGYYREPIPSPTGKGPGAYKIERKLRPGADRLIKDVGK